MPTGRPSGLEGCVLAVSGGTRGIGRAIVREAHRVGARVAYCARQPAAEGWETGAQGEVLGVAADVRREADVKRFLSRTEEAFDGLDAVICNAGITRDDLLVTMSTDDFDDVLATNLTGSFLVAREAAQRFMDRGGGGRIVLMGSVSQYGTPGQSNYAASKGGLWGLCRSIAAQLGEHGIAANLVVPGLVDTDMTAALPERLIDLVREHCPLRRMATPDEVARVAVFLASHACPLNGEAVAVHGGMMS